MSANAYGKYLKNEIEGASQGRLVVMMYDACVRFIRAGANAIGEKKIEEAHNNIIRAENIIYELMSTLNLEEGGEIAHELMRIYDFAVWHLIDANNSKNAGKLEEVVNILIPLRDAWKEIVLAELKINSSATQNQEQKSVNFAG